MSKCHERRTEPRETKVHQHRDICWRPKMRAGILTAATGTHASVAHGPCMGACCRMRGQEVVWLEGLLLLSDSVESALENRWNTVTPRTNIFLHSIL
jgi:hypothetical protein